MQENRLVERLKQYWKSICPEGGIPDMRRFNHDIITDLWPRCLMLEVANAGSNKTALFTYDYISAEIIKAYGSDLTGHHVNVNMHDFPGWQVLKSADKLIEKPDIYDSEGSFVTQNHKVVKYRAVLVPFGTLDRVTHVLVGISWKELG